jgi:hypothetical protein
VARAQEPPPLPPLPTAAWQPPLPPAKTVPARPAVPARPMWMDGFHKPAAPALPVEAQPEIRRAQFQRPPGAFGGEGQPEYQIQLLPPSVERLFRLQSEDALREQMRQEMRDKPQPERATFPEERRVTGARYGDRVYPPQLVTSEPYYVNYKRLYFQDLNSERYGWDLGFVQPFVSAGLFYFDVVTFPYHWASHPLECTDSSTGYCLPGDPVPYLLYPPELSATGAIGEAGAVLGLVAVFP